MIKGATNKEVKNELISTSTPNKIINHIYDNNLSREDAIRYLTIKLDEKTTKEKIIRRK